MNLSVIGRRTSVSAVVVALLFAAPVWAQGSQEQSGDQMTRAAMDPTNVAPYGWYVSFGFGGVSGANPIGSIVDDDEEKISSFSLGNGGFFSARAGRRLWWRLGVEGEFGYGSPGAEITETNLQGRNVTTSDFGDYSVGLISVSGRFDLADSRITPFLLGGVAVVFSRIESEMGTEADTNPGFLFGGGLDVRLKDNVNLRGDVRGLRSKINAPLLSRGILLPNVEAGKALSTIWIWSIGVSLRFG